MKQPTPKQKAKELYNEYLKIFGGINYNDRNYFHGDDAKKCVIVAVKELLRNNYTERSFIYSDGNDIHHTTYSDYYTNVLIEVFEL